LNTSIVRNEDLSWSYEFRINSLEISKTINIVSNPLRINFSTYIFNVIDTFYTYSPPQKLLIDGIYGTILMVKQKY